MKARVAATLSLLAGTIIGRLFYLRSRCYGYERLRKRIRKIAVPIVKAHGGRFVANGAPTTLSGGPKKPRIVVLAWNNMEQLQRWFTSPEFNQARQVGEKYAKLRIYAVPGAVPQ